AGVPVIVGGLEERDRRQGAVRRLAEEVVQAVLGVAAQDGVGHDRRRVLHGIADPAESGAGMAPVVALAEVPPPDAVGRELIADRRIVGLLWRHGERRGVHGAVHVVARVVVVEQVVAAWLAVAEGPVWQGRQELVDRADAGRGGIGALGVAAA